MHLQCLPPTRYASGCGRNDDPYLPHVGLGSIGMAATRETKYTVCTYCRVTITPYKKLLEHVTAAHRGKLSVLSVGEPSLSRLIEMHI